MAPMTRCFADDAFEWKGTALSAHGWYYAERSAIVAAILHFEIRSCAFVCCIENRYSQQLGVRENVGDEYLCLHSLISG